MSKCIYCGTELTDGALYCGGCGKKQEMSQEESVEKTGAGQAQQGYGQGYYGQTQQGNGQNGYIQPQTGQTQGQNGYAEQGYSQGYYGQAQQGNGQNGYVQPQTGQNQEQNGYANQGYGQNYYGQVQPGYGQAVYGQAQPMYGQAFKQSGYSSGKVHHAFAGAFNRVKTARLNVFQLICIIMALLIITSPFLDFATVHARAEINSSMVNKYSSYSDYFGYGNNYDMDDMNGLIGNAANGFKAKGAVGFNLFQLSKLSGTVRRAIDIIPNVNLDMLKDYYEMADNQKEAIKSTIAKETGGLLDYNEGIFNEVLGVAHIIIWGRFALLVLPYVIILAGIVLIVGTYMNKKKIKLIACGAVYVSLLWLMILSGHFFSMMGFGAVVMILAPAIAIVATVTDKEY